MSAPRDDEALAALAKELATLYCEQNGFDSTSGMFDETLISVIEHAIGYGFGVGYRVRVGEEGRPDKTPS